MQRFARIQSGLVAELIEIPANGPTIEDLYHADLVATCVAIPADSEVAEGWSWNGAVFAPPPAPPRIVPATISRRQLLLALAAIGRITDEEALAAATIGTVPAEIDAVFAGLPAEKAVAARITWATMGVVERAHPLLLAMIDAELMTAAEVDDLFLAAAAI